MEKIIIQKKRLHVDDAKIPELKEAIRFIREPGSWADTWTFRAFEQKWGMSVDEAEQLVGTLVTTTHWKDPT